MRVLAGLVERIAPDGRRLKHREVVGEFDKYLHDELDLIREASNCSQLRRNFGPGSGREDLLQVPEVIWEYCARDRKRNRCTPVTNAHPGSRLLSVTKNA